MRVRALLGSCVWCIAACSSPPRGENVRERAGPSTRPAPQPTEPEHDDPAADARAYMVQAQIESRGIEDARVLAAMRQVPREQFVPSGVRHMAYRDHPLPIGHDVTISQPYIVALMSELTRAKPGTRVLEVGTGSGYQAAVLAAMGAEVYSVEIIEPLADEAGQRLRDLGYDVHVRHGDGYAGWPDKAPFDAIIVTAAPPQIPAPLKQQLTVGGRLVIPVGREYQELLVVTRTRSGYDERTIIPVRFVPMTGKAQADAP